MDRVTWRTFVSVGIGLLAVFLVLGMSGATLLVSGQGSSARDGGTALMAGPTAHSVSPAVTLNTWVNTSAVNTTGPIAIQPVPIWVNFTIMYGNVTSGFAIAAANTAVYLAIGDTVSQTTYLNYSVPIVTSQAAYSVELDQSTLGCSAANCLTSIPDIYNLSLYVTLDGTGAGGTMANNDSGPFDTFQLVSALSTYVSLTGVSGPVDNSLLPAYVNFTIAYGGVEPTFAIASANTQVNLTVFDQTMGFNYGIYAIPIVSGQATYSVELNQAYFGCSAANCTATMPDTYSFSLWVSLSGVGNGGVLATNSANNFATTTWVNALSTWVNTAAASGPAKYNTLPAWVNFTIAFGGVGPSFVLSSANTQVFLQIYNETSGTNFGNWSIPIVTGQTSYSVTLNATTLNCATPSCSTTMTGGYAFFLWPSLDGVSARGMTSNNGTEYSPIASSSFITVTPTFAITAPSAATVPVGNTTVTVAYSAQYLTALTVNIYSSSTAGGAGGVLVYSSSFLNVSPVSKVWYEGTPGSYFLSLVAVSPYTSWYVNGTVTVANSLGLIYQNTTNWVNTTGGTSAAGYFGLSAAASGTLFLLVGLIVGILAALVAARMMMASPPPKPAQPWSDQKGETANTCSVCGKSFGSADELAAHSKSEHGMS